MKRQIKCILALLLIFAVMVMPAFAVKDSDDDYGDINDFFESVSNEDSDAAVDELFPSMGQGVGAVKQVKPIWNPAKFTTWFVIGLAVITKCLSPMALLS